VRLIIAASLSSRHLAPPQLDGFYRFELHRRDEREIVKMLVDLSVREPGEVAHIKPFAISILPLPRIFLFELRAAWLPPPLIARPNPDVHHACFAELERRVLQQQAVRAAHELGRTRNDERRHWQGA